MPRPDIEAIRARLDAATPGEWIADTDTRLITGESAVLMPYVEYPRVIHVRTRNARENATLIAHAPDDLAALLAYIAELEPFARAVASLPMDSCACWIDDPEATEHAPDCWIARARALDIPPTP